MFNYLKERKKNRPIKEDKTCPEGYSTIPQFALKINVDPETIRSWKKKGLIPCIDRGGKSFISNSATPPPTSATAYRDNELLKTKMLDRELLLLFREYCNRRGKEIVTMEDVDGYFLPDLITIK